MKYCMMMVRRISVGIMTFYDSSRLHGPSLPLVDLRQKYDNGQDPYDPSGGHEGGHFHHGGNPFGQFNGFPFGDFSGGGGQQFHFKMNF